MSEIKGQILGIVLVLAVFGVVAGTLYNAFVKSADEVGKKIETTWEPPESPAKEGENLGIISDVGGSYGNLIF